MSENYKYKEITGRIIGAAMEVHKTLGNGFQEVIYQRALSIEFFQRKLDHKREFVIPVQTLLFPPLVHPNPTVK